MALIPTNIAVYLLGVAVWLLGGSLYLVAASCVIAIVRSALTAWMLMFAILHAPVIRAGQLKGRL